MNQPEHISEKLKENQPKKNGGARPGAGRPKHSKNPATIEREAVKRAFQERVAKHADKLFNAQLDLAVGEKYLMVIRTVGTGAKQRRETSVVTDIELIKQYLDDTLDNTDEEYYFMTTKPANNMALDSLLNRSFGKADEKLDITSNNETIGKGEYDPETAQRFADWLKQDTSK